MSVAQTGFTPDRLFDGLSEREFDGFNSFQRAFLAVFNRHFRDFPSGYTYVDAIEWGIRHNRVRREADGRIVLSG